MHRKALLVTPIYLLVGLLLMSQNYLHKANVRAYEDAASTQGNQVSASAQNYAGTPISLYVPAINLSLQVAAGAYDIPSQTWSLSKDKAHYALNTLPANNKSGQTLIYGHNTPSVFGKISQLKSGNIIEVKTDNNLLFTYSYTDSRVVQPNDVSIFNYEGAPRLSLLSCTGQWYEQRLIMHFELKRVRHL